MEIGFISTFDKVIYGKNKKQKILYAVKFLSKKNQDNTIFLIPYNGKVKGNIILLFSVNSIINNYTICKIDKILGLLEDSTILPLALKYLYKIYRKPLIYIPEKNIYEKNINRIFVDKYIFSIDSADTIVIDDCISYEYNNISNEYIVSIYIAQPIVWLTEKIIYERLKESFSSLYDIKSVDHLWNNEISYVSSLIPNLNRDAICFEFTYDSSYTLRSFNFYLCNIINKIQTTYSNCLENVIINNFYKFTNNIANIESTHDLVSYWMKQVGIFVGKHCVANNIIIPYRITNSNNITTEINTINSINKIKDINIKNKFLLQYLDSALYSLTHNYHSSLKLCNYVQCTSPIRRIIDCLVHLVISYKINLVEMLNTYNITMDDINLLDKQTKKYHKTMNILNTINTYFLDKQIIVLDGYIYNINNNILTVYFAELDSFFKVKLWDNQFNYLITDYIIDCIKSINIGNKYKFEIHKHNSSKSILPKDKIKIIPIEFYFIERIYNI